MKPGERPNTGVLLDMDEGRKENSILWGAPRNGRSVPTGCPNISVLVAPMFLAIPS